MTDPAAHPHVMMVTRRDSCFVISLGKLPRGFRSDDLRTVAGTEEADRWVQWSTVIWVVEEQHTAEFLTHLDCAITLALARTT